ncbi:chromosome segregation protein SMC [Ectothiorhodospiraceae bacterium BW-2]|nr:chromosome segregation protein SMC [Ectothiorhodospiraceae bacterium BW-2]
MRLSRIKLAGFKSFVDPTTVPFPTNLTGVVGPNGCGKSNIIDAVRWVMGESSAKHLRGDSMTDVIFNGSTARKPVGQAAIELIFDNSDHTLTGEYAAFNDISIRRQLNRDGQSIYSLNGTRCRRRDITDIFLGTGLGPRSYAIIEQGMISRLIEARPEELRQLLEEAAGISKYKERRKETERRMTQTRDNLERLNDIREELQKQLDKLQRQADTARRYQALQQQQQQLGRQLLMRRWDDIEQLAIGMEQQLTQHQLQQAQLTARLTHTDTLLEQLRQQQQQQQQATQESQAELYRLGSELVRCEQTIHHKQEQSRQQQQQLEQLDQQYQQLAQQLQGDQQQQISHQLELQQLTPELQRQQQQFEELQLQLEQSESQQQQWQQRWEQFHQQAAEPIRTADLERQRIGQLEQQQQQRRERQQRLEQERQQLNLIQLEQELQQLQFEYEESDLKRQEQQQQLAQLDDEQQHQHHTLRQLEQQLNLIRQQLSEQQGQLSSLRTLQQAALNNPDSPLPPHLQQLGIADDLRLPQLLIAAAAWQPAVEAILQHAFNAICLIDGKSVNWSQFDQLTNTMVIFPPKAAPHQPPPFGRWLSDYVDGSWRELSLLQGVIAVESLDQALEWQPQLPQHHTMVTPEAIIVGQEWIAWPEQQAQNGNILQRQQQLEASEAAVALHKERLEQLQQQHQNDEELLAELQQQQQLQQQQLIQSQRQTHLLEGKLQTKQARIEHLQQRQQQLAQELTELEQQQQLDNQQLVASQQQLHRALAQTEELAQQRQQLQQQREHYSQQLQQQRHQRDRQQQQLHQRQLQQQQAQHHYQAASEACERGEAQLQLIAARITTLKQTLSETSSPIEALLEQQQLLLEQRAENELELQQRRQQLSQIEANMGEQEQQRLESEVYLNRLRERLATEQLTLQEQRVRQQTLLEQLDSDPQQRQELLKSLTPEDTVAHLEQQRQQLADRIARLGTINLAAIEEYNQQLERKNYLDAQFNDLQTALETLESAIRKIDRETRQRFKTVFEQVNQGLQQRFPTLFGGGSAYLELTGEDLLDTGVTIMARPPGKRNSTIHLLSGGEKALTAVALVFTIFELNPSPFCMLDEVDAPLDEANVGRFCAMVREMSQQVQFIFITHNKVTMELASTLAGVTMHEAGVSRLVAVDVEEAIEMATT